ncbi:MAG: hypothetical protein WBP65_16265, partial [Candidatus Sulfotelmatobacter sp.]
MAHFLAHPMPFLPSKQRNLPPGQVPELQYPQAIQEFEADAQLEGDKDAFELAAALNAGYRSGGWPSALHNGIEVSLAQAKSGYVPPYRIAELYADLGDKEHAFDWLNIVKGISGTVSEVYTANKAVLQFGHLSQKNQQMIGFDTTSLSDGAALTGTGTDSQNWRSIAVQAQRSALRTGPWSYNAVTRSRCCLALVLLFGVWPFAVRKACAD